MRVVCTYNNNVRDRREGGEETRNDDDDDDDDDGESDGERKSRLIAGPGEGIGWSGCDAITAQTHCFISEDKGNLE